MKFRHKSNFVPLELDQVILNIISADDFRYSYPVNLAKLLACILAKEDIESVLERFDYVKTETQ